MSFFYLTAVKGDLPVHLLEIIVLKRLEYLRAILNGDTVVYNEYVVEGGLYDNVGHFMLCIVAVLGENTGFSNFFMKAEVQLFKRRLECLSAYDTRCFAKRLLRNIKKYERVPPFVDALEALCQHLVLKDLAQHVCTASHGQACLEHNIKLHYKYCLTFISRRQVELKGGLAFIPCGIWRVYLVLLFTNYLKYKVNKTNLVAFKSDPRLTELLARIRKDFFSSINDSSNTLLCTEVDKASAFFPPCMLNLHQNLRQKHRLSHSQRFYYSLYLKDIGMPIEEAVDFWRTEYRLNPNESRCCHSWVKDEKKYLYGIRHMYGLVGCRKSYSSVNCQCIQSIDTSCTEGGCPFKTFDETKMVQLLNSPSELLLSQINELKRKRQYTMACMLYLKHNSKTNCDNFSFTFTPVKYYMIACKKTPCSMEL